MLENRSSLNQEKYQNIKIYYSLTSLWDHSTVRKHAKDKSDGGIPGASTLDLADY